MKKHLNGKKLSIRIIIFIFLMGLILTPSKNISYAMPFYGLNPKECVLRAEFTTRYDKSTEERKHNVKLASKALDGYFIDSNAEFSFNRAVGERTKKRGYKEAKIIFNGQFIDGVGGGVCQVSTTLYNALLLSGMKILECHPHSLPVNYVLPSFDAMVNARSADLKCVNTTKNPVIIKTVADGVNLTVKIYGEPMTEKYTRVSKITEQLAPPKEEILVDEKGEFPDLYKGEYRFLSYSKGGYKSEGYLIKTANGKNYKSKIRTDTYRAMQGKVIYGTAEKPTDHLIALPSYLIG